MKSPARPRREASNDRIWGDRFRRKAYRKFVLATFSRSARHRLVLAMVFGLGVGLVAVFSAGNPSTVRPGSSYPSGDILAAPLIGMFVVLTGIRASCRMPSQLEASWVFRSILFAGVEPCRRGLGQAMFAIGVLPVSAVYGLLVWSLSGPGLALAQLVFNLLAGFLLVQLLLWSFASVPFTRAFAPGGTRALDQGLQTIVAFSAFGFGLAGLEAHLMRSLPSLAIFLGGLAVLAFALRRVRTGRIGETPFDFDERSDTPAMRLDD